jgi:hypothetical protein
VPNTKVVANIQIYLHAKFHIFLTSSIILLFLFSPADLFNWKNRGGRFLRGRPSSAPTPAHLRVRSWPTPSASSGRYQVGPDVSRTPHVSLTPSWAKNRYAPDPPLRLLPPKPVSFLCYDTAGRHRPNSHRQVVHPSPPRATTVCPPATLSHRVGCAASWRPVTAAACICSSRATHR